MTDSTAIKTLKATVLMFVIMGGLLLAMASHPLLAALPNLFLDLGFWPFDGNPSANSESSRLLGAIGGGGFFGWGVCLWIIVRDILPVRPDLAHRAILAGVSSWFALDSTGSLLAGAWFNVIMNIVILLALVTPLMALSRSRVRSP